MDREATALAARAAARAKLAAAGQLLPSNSLLGSGAGSAGGDNTRRLVAARAAFKSLQSADAPSNRAEPALPQGWAPARDAAGRGYYFEKSTGRASWSAGEATGAPLPRGWWRAESSSGTYYYTAPFVNSNGVAGSLVTWEEPHASPPSLQT